jgi:hypothetical protein
MICNILTGFRIPFEDESMSAAVTEVDLASAPAKQLVAELLQRLPDGVSVQRIIAEIREVAGMDDTEHGAALRAIERMQRDATYEEIEDEIRLLIGLREADEEIEAGLGIPHDEVKRTVESWFSPSSGPPKP